VQRTHVLEGLRQAVADRVGTDPDLAGIFDVFWVLLVILLDSVKELGDCISRQVFVNIYCDLIKLRKVSGIDSNGTTRSNGRRVVERWNTARYVGFWRCRSMTLRPVRLGPQ
jgi:hypothetical protein